MTRTSRSAPTSTVTVDGRPLAGLERASLGRSLSRRLRHRILASACCKGVATRMQPNAVVLGGTRWYQTGRRSAEGHIGHDSTGLTGIGWYPICLTTDQKVGGSSPSGRARRNHCSVWIPWSFGVSMTLQPHPIWAAVEWAVNVAAGSCHTMFPLVALLVE